MTFEEWKTLQLELGNLAPVKRKRKDARVYPYTKMVGFGKKYDGHFAGRVSIKTCKFLLTIDEFLKLFYNAGIMSPDELGIESQKFHLARIGDSGDYTIDNCRFILGKDNLKERCLNGGTKIGALKRRGSNNGRYGDKSLSGTNAVRWSGYYHTPNGKFSTAKDAAEANSTTIKIIHRRCKSCDVPIDYRTISAVNEYGKECIGKTFRDLGWWFEEVNDG